MTDDKIPPCPSDLLAHSESSGPVIAGSRPGLVQPGTIWEVQATDGELLLFLVTERFDKDVAAPFAFARAVPLTDHLRLAGDGDAIVTCEPAPDMFVGHCWLEGPVLLERFRRLVRRASSQSMKDIATALSVQILGTADSTVAEFRRSLYGQFDPIFVESWAALDREDVAGNYQETEMARAANTGSSDDSIAVADTDSMGVGNEEDEMAIAADDGDLSGPTPAEQRTIEYLTAHLPEIIRHGNSNVWFAVDSDGALTAHTYDSDIAAGYTENTGPNKIPFFVAPSKLIEPDVRRLLDWMTGDLKLRRAAAEQVCVNLGWRC